MCGVDTAGSHVYFNIKFFFINCQVGATCYSLLLQRQNFAIALYYIIYNVNAIGVSFVTAHINANALIISSLCKLNKFLI